MKIDIFLEDRLQVQAPKALRDRKLSDAQREKLLDSFFNNPDQSKRGLYVTFDLSHSGKIINNRIYQPWAQSAGVPTWTEPVGLPIIKNHNQDADPIGRFVSVKWVSLEKEARQYLGDAGFNEVAEAYNSRDSKEIGRVMNKYKLVDNPQWPGLGKLEATAVINDREDIEKFLDGRHMSFSAGGKTNRVQCSTCGHTLRPFDTCEHEPGTLTDDGKYNFMVTNTYNGREGSVTPFPADKDANVRHMSFDPAAVMDSEQKPVIGYNFTHASFDRFLDTCDSEIVNLDLSILEDTDETATSEQSSAEDTGVSESADATTEAGSAEVVIDWVIFNLAFSAITGKTNDAETLAALPEDVFCAPERNLPIRDLADVEAAKTLLDRYQGDKSKLLDAIEARKSILDQLAAQAEEAAAAQTSADLEARVADLEGQVASLRTELEEAKALVAAKDAEIATLTASLAEAIRDRETTADSLESALDFLAKDKNVEISVEDSTNRLDALLGWFGTIVDTSETNEVVTLDLTPHPDDIELVSDPSLEDAKETQKLSVNTLGVFERGIVSKYHSRLNDYNEANANNWLNNLKSQGFVSADFDPTQYEPNSKE